MFSFEVVGDDSAAKRVTAEIDRQLPFALSRALNDTATQAQEAIRGGILARFHVRRQDFILNTVKIAGADFATKDRLKAVVRIDPSRNFLAKFEYGGRKAPTGRSIAVPGDVRGNVMQVIPKGLRPRAFGLSTVRTRSGQEQIKGAQRTFLIRSGGFEGILQRLSKGRARLLYLLRPGVELQPILRFEQTAREVAAKNWDGNVARAVQFAMATAR